MKLSFDLRFGVNAFYIYTYFFYEFTRLLEMIFISFQHLAHFHTIFSLYFEDMCCKVIKYFFVSYDLA